LVCQEDNLCEWQLKNKTIWEGVKWLDAAHTTDGWDSVCAGIATFVCDRKTVIDVDNGTIVRLPVEEKYPQYQLREILLTNTPQII